MKLFFIGFLALNSFFLIGCSDSDSQKDISQHQTSSQPADQNSLMDQNQSSQLIESEESDMIIATINGKEFTIILNESRAAQEFKELLPLTIEMEDVNGNEKYQVLDKKFTTNAQKVNNIQAGDLKLWSGNGLVLFYKSFSSAYSYTDLGSMQDTNGLSDVLTNGTVSITFTNPEVR